MKRPLVQVGLLYVAGILVGGLIPLPLATLLVSAFGLAVFAAAWARARPFLLFPLIILAGWTNQTLHTAILSPNDLRAILGDQAEIVTVRGVLRETPSLRVFVQDEAESWRTMAQIDVTSLCPNRQNWGPASVASLSPPPER
jgi:hypothetical protein